jgi:hypothetical protein
MADSVPPLPYQIFFLYIEPIATLVGAYYAFFQPETYLQLIQSSRIAGILAMPTATLVALRGLGNMYLAFALSEALVLRVSYDMNVWRMFLLVLLIADFGHLYSCLPLGLELYYDVMKWNAIDWGNIGFVYAGATIRTLFLANVGMGGPKKAKAKGKKAIKSVADLTPEPFTPSALEKTPAQSTRRRKNKSRS